MQKLLWTSMGDCAVKRYIIAKESVSSLIAIDSFLFKNNIKNKKLLFLVIFTTINNYIFEFCFYIL